MSDVLRMEGLEMSKRYWVKSWIPIDFKDCGEDAETHRDLSEAIAEMDHCSDLQPENYYEVVLVDTETGEEEEVPLQ